MTCCWPLISREAWTHRIWCCPEKPSTAWPWSKKSPASSFSVVRATGWAWCCSAYLQTPLTFDTATTAILLDESEIGLAGRETAIGDAIGLAVKRLRDDAASERVLILLTDGANTSGEVQPMQATEFAAREGMTIYTVGVGADEMMVQDFFGSRLVNPSADLDEDTLRAIAERTGGAYFRARDAEDLARIYERLDELEPVESDQEVIRPVDELFYWPLSAAFLLALLGVFYAMSPGLRRGVTVA